VSTLAVIFTVQDLDRSYRFYTEVLGLTLERGEGYLSGKLPQGCEVLFFEGEATRGTSPQIVFGLDEGGIDSVAEGLVKQGVQLLTQVTEAPGGWSFEFRDPDAHGLAFYQSAEQPRRARDRVRR
jgi:predicted enzyme related to lactoylglutathione lyase